MESTTKHRGACLCGAVGVEDVRASYRQQPQGSHLIFYQTESGAVHIVRILHERMMPQGQLSEST